MTIRTRMAFTVILFLVGCALASPYLRKSTETASSGDAPISTTPTLQIQRSFSPDRIDAGAVDFYRPVGVATPAPAASISADGGTTASEQRAPERPDQQRGIVTSKPQPPNFGAIASSSSTPDTASSIAAMPTQPFPKLQMPPPLEVNRARLQPVGSPQTGQRMTALKPVRMQRRPDTDTVSAWTPQRPGSTDTVIPKPVPRRIDGQADRPRLETVPQTTSQFTGSATVGRAGSSFAPVQASRQTTLHRIVNGDTLADISQTYYGSPEYAMAIFHANRNELISPEILPIGRELVIPDKNALSRGDNRLDNRLSGPQPMQAGRSSGAVAQSSQDGWRRAASQGF